MNDQDAELSYTNTIILHLLLSMQKLYYKFKNSVVVTNI